MRFEEGKFQCTYEEGKFQCTYIIPAGLKAFNLLYSLELQLFHERCSFSPPRLPPCGVPRCMGRSDGKRNAPLQSQTPCSPCPGLCRSAGRSPGSGGCKQAAASSSRCCGYGYGLAGLSRQNRFRCLFLLGQPCSHRLILSAALSRNRSGRTI